MTIQVSIPRELAALSAPQRSVSAPELALVERLESGRAALPMLPAVASAALDLANDPETSIAKFADLVATDPPIAARFLATANSALYSRGRRIASVHDAVARVGIAGARDLVLQVVYAATLGGLKRYQEEIRRSFRQSVLSAHMCRFVVTELQAPCRDPYLCGLLHDIGESRVYRILSELPTPASNAEATDLVQRYHAHAGGELADKWKLPEEIALVCRKHTELRAPETEELRVVRIADLVIQGIAGELAGTRAEVDPSQLEVLEVGKSDVELLRAKGLELAKAS